jgi:hypothetical protein
LGGYWQKIELGKCEMTSELAFLLKSGWDNLWKNRIIWLFSSLVLIEPLLRFFLPLQRYEKLFLSFLNLVISWASLYFMFLSIAGVSFVAYCVATETSVDVKAAFQASHKLFWRSIALWFLVALAIVPLTLIIASALWNLLLIKNLSHNYFYAAIPISVFAAMLCFPITEVIANNSSIGKSLKSSWIIFTHNFFNLSIVGFLLLIGLRVTALFISIVIFLFQNNFDISVINKFDFISPELSFPQNMMKLVVAIPNVIWQAFSISTFTVAYLKYGGAKMSKDNIA